MIKTVTVVNYVGDKLVLDLRDPYSTGFLITKIEGLGPVKADINTTKFASNDGSRFLSARANDRNIKITFRLIGTPTIEETRVKLYKFFPVKKKVKLIFETDLKNITEYANRTVSIEGYVESNDPDIFSKTESVNVSIVCPAPYFESIRQELTTFSGIEPCLEFPLGLDEDEDSFFDISRILQDTVRSVYYNGEVDTGMIINIHAYNYASNITIYNVDTGESMIIKIDLEPLDDIVISTIQNEKTVRLLRHGMYINILNNVVKGSDWFTLRKGDNVFAYVAETGEEFLTFSVKNKLLYEGI